MSSTMKSVLILGGVGFVVFFGIIAVSVKALEGIRICKPVVPEIEVRFKADSSDPSTNQLLLIYYEEGLERNNRKKSGSGARYSGCLLEDTSCVGSRARYEIRLEEPREQSIQIRTMGSEGNRHVGDLHWSGPSYPDNVKVSCDLSNADPETACDLLSINYSAFGANGERPEKSRHDKCMPLKGSSTA